MAGKLNAASLAEAAKLVKKHGSINAAAAATGKSRTTLQRHAKAAVAEGVSAVSESEIEFPNLPSSEGTADEIIDHACKEFSRSMASRNARRWMPIKINSNKPIGVAFMGDPHVDSAGCNWPLLREHLRILRDTPGMYAVGGQDVADGWVGRLVRLYADSKMSRKQSLKVIKWLFRESKVRWLCHVLGNHDLWADNAYLLKAAAEEFVPVEEWAARFRIVFPNGNQVRVHCAHDFKGHSQWNHLHGAKKEAMWGEEADIFSCHHRHCWGVQEEENAQRGFVYWLIRSRGYKYIDSYADQHGFGSQRFGASVTAIIDPTQTGAGKVRCFPELGEAAEFLTWKRERAR